MNGVAVRQEQPLTSDVPCVADYYSRKGCYAYNVEVMLNAKYEFISMQETGLRPRLHRLRLHGAGANADESA